ncbi:MAG TPA: hypothetical protein VJU84_05355 [Pyrinomonadaceae bacterium]|nr:hypothetical protein [Pyrinomonadaceae bacterium]
MKRIFGNKKDFDLYLAVAHQEAIWTAMPIRLLKKKSFGRNSKRT